MFIEAYTNPCQYDWIGTLTLPLGNDLDVENRDHWPWLKSNVRLRLVGIKLVVYSTWYPACVTEGRQSLWSNWKGLVVVGAALLDSPVAKTAKCTQERQR